MFGRAVLALCAAVGVVGFWGAVVERNRFTLREVSVPVLPPGSRPIRVLHLSDAHMAPWQRHKQRWIASLASLRPDLVVFTGDALGHRDGLAGLRVALGPFSGIAGVFVNGSNDYFAPELKNPFRYLLGPSRLTVDPKRINTAALLSFYAELGWVGLNNTARQLNVKGVNIATVGVDDPHLEYDDLDAAVSALSALPQSTVLIGVSHAPYRRVLDRLTEQGCRIIFAGHTHGGQVCLPETLGGALVTNCDLPRAQAKGLSSWVAGARSSALHVSAGIGTSIYAPIRVFCPPEATLVTLTAADSAGGTSNA
ncbi:MAG: metallophosphoesterase [Agromyces sp.]